jgi:hypothetical protein
MGIIECVGVSREMSALYGNSGDKDVYHEVGLVALGKRNR